MIVCCLLARDCGLAFTAASASGALATRGKSTFYTRRVTSSRRTWISSADRLSVPMPCRE